LLWSKRKKVPLASIENAPLIRKFTVLFIVMSLLPFSVFAYIFWQISSQGKVDIGEPELFNILILLAAGSLIGFYGMRKTIWKIAQISRNAKEALIKNIPEAAKVLTGGDNELEQLTQAFQEITRNLENNITRLEESRSTMRYVLSKISVGIASIHNTDAFLELIVEITANALNAKVGVLMILDEAKNELFIKSASGVPERFINTRIPVGEEGPGWVAKYRKPLMIPALHKHSGHDESDIFMPPLLCAPMLFQDKLVGVLAVAGRDAGGSFQEDELLIISNLASQTAVAIENERLNLDAEKTYLETVSALAMAVEARDPYSRGHLDRVSDYAVRLARKLGLDEGLIEDIKDAAELHDVGKIGISDDILKKAGKLTDEEMSIMRKHPVIGESIIKPLRSLSRLCGIIRYHHEFVDGTGYPDKLKGDQIPIGAKVLAVVDSFDAMTTERPYNRRLNFEEAKEELRRCIGTRYDKKVVEAFVSII